MAEKKTTGKNIAEVVIDGRIYHLSGGESESYMHEIAAYLNQKILDIKKEVANYNKLDDSMKAILLEINICDDMFRQRTDNRRAAKELEDSEREAYSARHDLVNMQMKLETTLKELENTQRKLADAEAKLAIQAAKEEALRENAEAEQETRELKEKILTTDKTQSAKVSQTLQKMLN